MRHCTYTREDCIAEWLHATVHGRTGEPRRGREVSAGQRCQSGSINRGLLTCDRRRFVFDRLRQDTMSVLSSDWYCFQWSLFCAWNVGICWCAETALLLHLIQLQHHSDAQRVLTASALKFTNLLLLFICCFFDLVILCRGYQSTKLNRLRRWCITQCKVKLRNIP